MNALDLKGQRFGRWLVIEYSHATKQKKGFAHYWLCLCNCGVNRPVIRQSLTDGLSVSCGCYQREAASAANTIHGGSAKGRSPEYVAWNHMNQRCGNPKDAEYFRYGARGITVCTEWQTDFARFLKDIGARPTSKHSLERKDNSLGYSADNCKWATSIEQNNNNRRNRMLRFDGRVQSVAMWAREHGVNPKIYYKRINSGWTTSETLTIPVSADKTGWGARRARA